MRSTRFSSYNDYILDLFITYTPSTAKMSTKAYPRVNHPNKMENYERKINLNRYCILYCLEFPNKRSAY